MLTWQRSANRKTPESTAGTQTSVSFLWSFNDSLRCRIFRLTFKLLKFNMEDCSESLIYLPSHVNVSVSSSVTKLFRRIYLDQVRRASYKHKI